MGEDRPNTIYTLRLDEATILTELVDRVQALEAWNEALSKKIAKLEREKPRSMPPSQSEKIDAILTERGEMDIQDLLAHLRRKKDGRPLDRIRKSQIKRALKESGKYRVRTVRTSKGVRELIKK